MSGMLKGIVGRACPAAGIVAICAVAGCVQPRIPAPAPGQSIAWLLRVGPQRGSQPIVCASNTPPPCAITRGIGEQRIESTVVIYLPPTANHHFGGEVLVGFVGADIGPAGHALRVDQTTTPDASYEAAVVGLVTFKPGIYPIQIRLEETGADLDMPRRHSLDVMVQVR